MEFYYPHRLLEGERPLIEIGRRCVVSNDWHRALRRILGVEGGTFCTGTLLLYSVEADGWIQQPGGSKVHGSWVGGWGPLLVDRPVKATYVIDTVELYAFHIDSKLSGKNPIKNMLPGQEFDLGLAAIDDLDAKSTSHLASVSLHPILHFVRRFRIQGREPTHDELQQLKL